MPFTKVYESAAATLTDVRGGSTILLGATSASNAPTGLLTALLETGIGNLTCVCDFDDWHVAEGIPRLAAAGRIARIISPRPFSGPGGGLLAKWKAGELDVEVIPRGILAERLRAAGAGIGGVFVPVGPGTRFADGKEARVINGVECVLELPLRGDFALLRAHGGDTQGNLVYRSAQRGWNAVMAAAARVAIAEVDHVGEPGTLDPELVITPGIFVNRIVAADTASAMERP
jgi:3-oxoadipate CoA-transferase alpha subunit